MNRHASSFSSVHEAFWKLSLDSNDLLNLKQEQEDAVNYLLEGRDVVAVMQTGYGNCFIHVFQLFAVAVVKKKVYERM